MLADLRNVRIRDKKITPPQARDYADHRRMVIVAVSDQNIADRGDPVAAGIVNWPAQNLRKVQHKEKIV